ncbi:rhamnose mutarotase [Vararia minispora EC-137]|uniref:Rhamnose mutarotase n=1 Tax=Vararia minispora EC-137 TaxID=1314806 RepID=A0ACB8QCD3_9AGAM|nr:rhamnose mutarotase [Vararia minispora EC-137]
MPSTTEGRRICQIIKLKPEAEAEYLRVHKEVWPNVLAALERAHIVDYSIFYHKPLGLLIATMKYVGDDWARDSAINAQDEDTKRWWAMTDGMQESFIEGATGSGKDVPWWTEVPEVFRFEGTG